MIALTIEGMSPALPQIVLQIWIWEISNGKTIANSFALIAHMNFSLENYSYELVNLTGTVGKVELIPTSITAVCESWNVSDKDTWDNVGDLKVGSHDPIFVQLSFRIFFMCDEKRWRSHNPIFPSNYFMLYSRETRQFLFWEFRPISLQL